MSRSVVGLQGTMYQKCPGRLDAFVRLVQAQCIGGMVKQIPNTARDAADMSAWLDALADAPAPPIYISPEILPLPLGSPIVRAASHYDAAAAATDDGRDAGCPSSHWTVLDFGTLQPLVGPDQLPFRPSASRPQLRAEGHRLTGHLPSRQRSPSPYRFTSPAPSLSAVGGVQPWSDPTRSSSPSQLPPESANEGQFFAVYCGRTPWIYTTQ